ncbi:hypothetical protein ERO13_A02G094300v2 [Gossypium hirsutum]|nr:hypothetical protein ERO13_A02G094300v2 [Gossypium hirsutum]
MKSLSVFISQNVKSNTRFFFCFLLCCILLWFVNLLQEEPARGGGSRGDRFHARLRRKLVLGFQLLKPKFGSFGSVIWAIVIGC